MSDINQKQVLTSNDSIFDDIRPAKDEEVASELQKIIEDKELIDGIIKFRFKSFGPFFAWILRPIVKNYIKKQCAKIKTIADFQQLVADFMKNMIATTTDGVDFIGFDKFSKDKGYLFVSNHRDISLDPAFVDYALHINGMDTVRIAIGDNLLKTQAATSLMRINKSFIVKRSISSLREKLKELTKLSTYIGLSIKEGHSIWIAQREGRAKNGDDKTEIAVLKMFYVYGKSLGMSFKDYISSLNLVPVSITYEYDPGDLAKAKELYSKEHEGHYEKSDLEDLISIASGITGYKGRVQIVAGDPIKADFETPEQLAQYIDNFIYSNYKMYPSTLIAANVENNCTQEEKDAFNQRIMSYPEKYRQKVLDMYAMPYKNFMKISKKES